MLRDSSPLVAAPATKIECGAPRLLTVADVSPDYPILRRMGGVITPIYRGMRLNINRQSVLFTDDVARATEEMKMALLTRGSVGEERLSALDKVGIALSVDHVEAAEAGFVLGGKPIRAQGEEWRDADPGPGLGAARSERFADGSIEHLSLFDFSSEKFQGYINNAAKTAFGICCVKEYGSFINSIRAFQFEELGGYLVKDLGINPQKFAFVAPISGELFADHELGTKVAQSLVDILYRGCRHRQDRARVYLNEVLKGVFVLPIEAEPYIRAAYIRRGVIHYDQARDSRYLHLPFDKWLESPGERFAGVNRAYDKVGLRLALVPGKSYAEDVIAGDLEMDLELMASSIINGIKSGTKGVTPEEYFAVSSDEISYLRAISEKKG